MSKLYIFQAYHHALDLEIFYQYRPTSDDLESWWEDFLSINIPPKNTFYGTYSFTDWEISSITVMVNNHDRAPVTFDE